MKIRINIIVIVLAIVVIQSCKDEKDDPAIGIAGSWKLQTKEYLECPNIEDNEVIDCSTGVYGFCNTFIFKADGTFEYKRNSDGSNLGNGPYAFGNNQLSVFFSSNPGGFPDIIAQPVTISGTTLTYISGDVGSCKIKMTYQKQ